MKKVFGNLGGLKANQQRYLVNLYRRRIPPENIVTPEICRTVSRLSRDIRRQIGIMINRRGKIVFVMVGNGQGIIIPDTREYRIAPGRLLGLRCVHTHLNNLPLTQEDLTDLALLRLDLIAVITVTRDGHPHRIHVGHILPTAPHDKPYRILDPMDPNRPNVHCLDLIQAIEDELSHMGRVSHIGAKKERALLVSVSTQSKHRALDSLTELKELAVSSGIHVIGIVRQQRKRIDPRFLMGMGKLQDLGTLALHKGASLIIFDQELNPSQIRSITDRIDLKVIDRTQLILDIFAQRAKTKEGKLQVEQAQLKYLLPRLITKNTAMSRLTGGIGGRGPGETKLEINRRRVRDRIKRLEKSLSKVKNHRRRQRAKRNKNEIPVISIIGYTNAGKSTLLNVLTQSNVLAESRLFATLDPASRRLRFPRDMEVIITDTVGFIKDLPKDLLVAFRATLEELENADLLLHVIDISNPRCEDQIESVERILVDLNLNTIPLIRVLNKVDRLNLKMVASMKKKLNGTSISAINKPSLVPLIHQMAATIREIRPRS